jgi:adenosylhomocysteine/aminodeoxyfutalosine nucleosidase
MILIAAALDEELKTAMALCRNRKKIPNAGSSLWQAMRGDETICFLRTGVGPKRSAAHLLEALKVIRPSHIMVVGYAGAIDPVLKLGDLVAVEKALAFSLDKESPGWEHARLEDTFKLSRSRMLASSAKSAGLKACIGNVLTSSYVLGEPAHKQLLYEKFHASIVDMETAALARAAAANKITLSCIRAVSDEAADSFLAPFSHNPSASIPARAKKILDKGMNQTLREWKNHSSVARASLSRFLSHYL